MVLCALKYSKGQISRSAFLQNKTVQVKGRFCVMEMFSTSMVVMAPCVFAYVPTRQDGSMVCVSVTLQDTCLKVTTCRQASGIGVWKGAGWVVGDELGRRGRTSLFPDDECGSWSKTGRWDTVPTVTEVLKRLWPRWEGSLRSWDESLLQAGRKTFWKGD